MTVHDDLDIDDDYPDEHANAGGAVVITARVDWTTEDVKREPDGRLVLEDIDMKASPAATATRGVVAVCEACELPCAARRQAIDETPWTVVTEGAGMLETVVAEVPSSLPGGMFRAVWVCSDACEEKALAWAGLDPITAGFRT